jgi:hypothetical protein
MQICVEIVSCVLLSEALWLPMKRAACQLAPYRAGLGRGRPKRGLDSSDSDFLEHRKSGLAAAQVGMTEKIQMIEIMV